MQEFARIILDSLLWVFSKLTDDFNETLLVLSNQVLDSEMAVLEADDHEEEQHEQFLLDAHFVVVQLAQLFADVNEVLLVVAEERREFPVQGYAWLVFVLVVVTHVEL